MIILEGNKMQNTKGYKEMGLQSQVTLNQKLLKKGWKMAKPGVFHYAKFDELAIFLENTKIQQAIQRSNVLDKIPISNDL